MKHKKMYLAGHSGMVGSAIHRRLIQGGYTNILTRELDELNLVRQSDVEQFFESEKPELVIIAAARVGGILANNTFRAEFIYDNLMIESNLIHAAKEYGAEKVIFLGSSCIYPKLAEQPLKEEALLSGFLEYTNEPYAIAKIAGIKLCENYYKQYGSNFYSVMPTNLYGINDNFNLQNSHVLPALIRKFHSAKQQNDPSVPVWGSGSPKREFLFVDDVADAIVYLMERINATDLYEQNLTHLNIGTGEDLRIGELAELIKDIVGFEGTITYDDSKPDGTPRKVMDVSRLHELGWQHKYSLREGIEITYKWFLENLEKGTIRL